MNGKIEYSKDDNSSQINVSYSKQFLLKPQKDFLWDLIN